MKQRKPDESDEHYIRRLEDANASLKQQNESIKKWAANLNEAVTTLSCEASLAFQAMAEKAGVRSHPSVTVVVELFDTISHPQWRGDKKIPEIKFPQFWDLDGPAAWSGDADMALNSPIAEAIEFLDAARFSVKPKMAEHIPRIIDALHKVARDGVEGIKDRNGFKPKHLSIPSGHFRDMDAEQLRNLLDAMSWMALDLAQDMAYANEMLRRDLRAATYRRVCGDLYTLSHLALEVPEERSNFDIKVLGGESLPF